MRILKLSLAMNHRYSLLYQHTFNAFCQLAHNLIFTAYGFSPRAFLQISIVHKSLGGDTSCIQTGASGLFVFYDCNVQAVTCRVIGSAITAGSAAYND